MSYVEYEKAQKLGLKAYRTALQRGKYPYLPVLDEILRNEDLKGEVPLGLVQVPLSRVVGTSTVGRTSSFANNFMPILDYKTEFGMKWSNLCDSHMEEGIRDPIKVYEYLNYYYVIEGNKRVSVLKYFDAVSVPANVIRKVPKLTDDPEIRIYYEFMEFNRLTGINNIWFSKEGSFERLYDLTTLNKKEDWGEDEQKDFNSAYYLFSNAFEAKGGKKMENITTGDAFLIFIEIYGYDGLKEMSSDEIKANISKVWKEYLFANARGFVDISMNPPSEVKKNRLSQIFIPQTQPKVLKVAFVYDKKPEKSDWLYGHELGRNHIKETFGERVSALKVICDDTEASAVKAMEDLVNMGTDVIFTTTSRLISASLKVAVRHPEVKILNCSLNTSHSIIRTYYARLYEAKFLTGMIAGALADNNKIGYVADYPIIGMIANINAFALGAAFVNPRARVYLQWTTLKERQDSEDIYKAFRDEGIEYVSDQDMIVPSNASRKFGLYRLEDDTTINLAMSVYNWGVLYEKIIRIILNGLWKDSDTQEAGETKKAINYWWGISAGAIDVILSKRLPDSTRHLVETVKRYVSEGMFYPFSGKILSQNNEIKNEEGNIMTPQDIMKMDWLAVNIIGNIPEIDELEETARPIVELKGVLKDEDEDIGIGR